MTVTYRGGWSFPHRCLLSRSTTGPAGPRSGGPRSCSLCPGSWRPRAPRAPRALDRVTSGRPLCRCTRRLERYVRSRASWICWVAVFAASCTDFLPVEMSTSVFWRMRWPSTEAQFFDVGTNHDFCDALKDGSSAFRLRRVVVFGMTPTLLTRLVWTAVLVYALIHSRARSCCFDLTGTVRCEPPRKAGAV